MSVMRDPQADGEALYREFIGAVASKDWALVDAILAADFQSVHTDGPRDKVIGELQSGAIRGQQRGA